MFKDPFQIEDIILGLLSLFVGAWAAVLVWAAVTGFSPPEVKKVVTDEGVTCYIARRSSGIDCDFGGNE
jgi:hypothetical protein